MLWYSLKWYGMVLVLYGMEPPIDCADSNDCSCNEMMLTTEIDHLSLLVIEQVSSERRSHNKTEGKPVDIFDS